VGVEEKGARWRGGIRKQAGQERGYGGRHDALVLVWRKGQRGKRPPMGGGEEKLPIEVERVDLVRLGITPDACK